ncbi:MAG: hypothetical protein V3W34_13040 [Phycisphaerae bacterium]
MGAGNHSLFNTAVGEPSSGVEAVQPTGISYTKPWSACRRLFRDDRAVTTTEYAVMLGIIVMAAILGFSNFAERLEQVYLRIDDELIAASG